MDNPFIVAIFGILKQNAFLGNTSEKRVLRVRELRADLTEKPKFTHNDYSVPMLNLYYIIAKESRTELIFLF